jgi:hypothetical protein
MQCRLITDVQNPVGLATDAELLGAFLRERGHEVALADWRGPASGTFDVNFYLEKFAPMWLRTARKHVGVFNLEWFDEKWVIHLASMTQIWAKSAVAHEWFMEHGFDQVRFTGWLSCDPFMPQIVRSRLALHVAGRSSAKNTTAVLRAYWDAYAAWIELPILTLVGVLPIDPLPPRVIQRGHAAHGMGLVRDELDRMINSHRFHLCPSEVEGWGHYITEATACGGIVITTDASPMHEHVLPTFGRLIAPLATTRRGLVDRHAVDPADLINALIGLNRLSDAELDQMGALARAWNRQRNAAFAASATRLLEELEA